MDLKVFYQKLKQIEGEITETHPVIVSQETPDGGREGVKTEVPRAIAARMVAEAKARLATSEEASDFREATAEAKRVAEQALAASRMQLSVMPEAELRMLRKALQKVKAEEGQ